MNHLSAGEREQLMGQVGRAFGRAPDLLDVTLHPLAPPLPIRCRLDRAGQLLGDEGGVVEDHREQVVEVVSDPAREPSENLHTLGLLQVGFQQRFVGISRELPLVDVRPISL